MDDAQFQQLLGSIGNNQSQASPTDDAVLNHVKSQLPDPNAFIGPVSHQGAQDFIKTGTVNGAPLPKQGVAANLPGVIKDAAVNYGKNVAGQYMDSAKTVIDNTKGVLTGQKKIQDAVLQNGGEFAKSVFAPITEAIKPVVQGDANALANNEPFQKVANSAVGGAVDNANIKSQQFYQSWAQMHPEAAKNLEAGINVAALIGAPEAESIAKSGLSDAVDTAKSGLNTAKNGLQATSDFVEGSLPKTNAPVVSSSLDKASQSTWDMVKPELSKLDQAKAVQEGRIVTTGKLGTITQVPKGNDLAMIEAAKPYVATAKNEIEAVANMQKGIANEATTLRKGLKDTGATYTKSQLQGAFAKIEEDPNLMSDATLAKKAELLQSKALEFAGNGGTLDKLQDVNTKLDAYIKKYYPNLYSSDTLTPLRQAIKETRNAIKSVIESRLKEGEVLNSDAYLSSLKKQSLLYDAIENTASKTPKVGSNAVTRFVKAHPTATKIGAGVAAGTLGVPVVKQLIP